MKTNEGFEKRKEQLKQQLKRIRNVYGRVNDKLTVARLKTMKGFEHLSDQVAQEMLTQLEELATIVLKQLNRITSKNKKS